MTTEKAPLFERVHRNLLITGHRGNRLPQDKTSLDSVRAALGQAIDAIQAIAKSNGQKVRILTGMSDGTDQMAADIAVNGGIPLQLIAVNKSTGKNSAFDQAERVSLVFEHGPDSPIEKWVAAIDEAKLALADAVIVVWDGKAPHGYAGGTVRLLIDALRGIAPVVWVDARAEFAGQVRVLNPGKLDAPTLVRLNSEEVKVENLQQIFNDAACDLQTSVNGLISPFWRMDHSSKLDFALRQDAIDPKDDSTRVGFWHSHFLTLFGDFKRRKAGPVQSWRPPDQVQRVAGLPESTWLWFDRFDRAATHAANRHRDQIVLIHLLSSFAVFGAVAGAVDFFELGNAFWGLFELATLIGISFIIWKDQHSPMKAHAAWMHFRQAGEAIRMSAILHPVLARLGSLHMGVWQPARNGELPTLAKPYHWLVIQLLREAGLPATRLHCMENKREELVTGLKSLLSDQMTYHQNNHHRTHAIHHRLHLLTQSVFYLVVATILLHLFALAVHALEQNPVHLPNLVVNVGHWIHDQHWWLLLTAFLPALAAGLHGIMSKLGLQQVARSSKKMNERLQTLNTVVQSLRPQDGLMTLRMLIENTAATMYAEHDAWADLMQDQNLEIPA